MDFTSGLELLQICEKENIKISQAIIKREIELTGISEQEIRQKMKKSLDIMESSIKTPLVETIKSMGGLIGGEAKKVFEFNKNGNSICGGVITKAIMYSMAVLETNASMGLIVAAPTAGSSGVLPALLFSLKDEFNLSEEILLDGLFNSSALGYIIMRNASVSGAEAGCQAEVGSASAMAAAACVEMMGGTPSQCFHAASIAISNLLGLVCDPIAGLVESPCQSRNVIGVTNALTCAEIALSGIEQIIPFDEMVGAMYSVGKGLPFELRETALGGVANTPTGCKKHCQIFGN